MLRLRREILDLLSGSPGEYVSGEKISQKLAVTRAAVWKQIRILEEEGFEIAGQTRKGYCLLRTPFSLNEWVLTKTLSAASLGDAGAPLGYKLYLEDELKSTNARARELVQQDGYQRQLVLARRQSSGRGRQRRHWEAPEGGLWMSVALQPKLSLADAAKITLAASVAVADALEECFSLRVGIKWPNDLLYEEMKLVGILGEVVGEWNTVQALVLGVGVNANFPRKALSSGLAATTLYEILGKNVDLNALTASILYNLEKQTAALERQAAAPDKQAFQELRNRWMERAVGIGKEVRIRQEEQVIQGVFRGINLDGALLLDTETGEVSLPAGDLEW